MLVVEVWSAKATNGGGEGETGEGETEVGAAKMRLACTRYRKSSLLTRRHAGDAGGAAKSEATTHARSLYITFFI